MLKTVRLILYQTLSKGTNLYFLISAFQFFCWGIVFNTCNVFKTIPTIYKPMYDIGSLVSTNPTKAWFYWCFALGIFIMFDLVFPRKLHHKFHLLLIVLTCLTYVMMSLGFCISFFDSTLTPSTGIAYVIPALIGFVLLVIER